MPVKAPWHEKLLQAYVPIPTVEPGDTVWWHPDVIHGVEDHNKGPGYSNVFYIGAAPDCAKNRAFLDLLRPAFEKGESSLILPQKITKSTLKAASKCLIYRKLGDLNWGIRLDPTSGDHARCRA